MKKIIVIAIVVAIGWYGNYLYKQHGLALVQHSSPDLEYAKEVKCITKDGSVIYGSVPHGTICEKVEPIEGLLTVIRSESPSQKKINGIHLLVPVEKIVEPQVLNVTVEHIALK